MKLKLLWDIVHILFSSCLNFFKFHFDIQSISTVSHRSKSMILICQDLSKTHSLARFHAYSSFSIVFHYVQVMITICSNMVSIYSIVILVKWVICSLLEWRWSFDCLDYVALSSGSSSSWLSQNASEFKRFNGTIFSKYERSISVSTSKNIFPQFVLSSPSHSDQTSSTLVVSF